MARGQPARLRLGILPFLDFETELKKAIKLVEDLRIAHSIAQAVDLDAAALRQVNTEESQAHPDPDLAAIHRQQCHRR